MNILHMRYAVEVSLTGSINKAAESLFVAQPNLSRSIKELESDLGITIFERSPQGMVLTPDGETFISYAKKILSQIDEVETIYRGGTAMKQRFSVTAPRANYISEAFAAFSCKINADPAEVFYREANLTSTINGLVSSNYKLGVVRCAEGQEEYYKSMLSEKGLVCEPLTEFRYVLVMRSDSILAKEREIRFSSLKPLIEVAHADPAVPSLPATDARKEELSQNIRRRIYIFDRSSQFDILSANKDAFMWVSPIPKAMLDRYGLIQRVCEDNTKKYKDMLAYRSNYNFTELDRLFVAELKKSISNMKESVN